MTDGIMLIRTFVLKVINDEIMKPLMTLQNKLCRYAKNKKFPIISLIFVLYKYGPSSRNFVKENEKPFTAIKTIINQ